MPTDRVLLADLIERYPGRYRDTAQRAERCPACGSEECEGHEAPPLRVRREPPPAPTDRRAEGDAPVDPVPASEAAERLVVAKSDLWADVIPAGCVSPVSILQVAKGQALPLTEAEALGIEWQEQDGPRSFGLSFKDGIPTVLEGKLEPTEPVPDFAAVDDAWDALDNDLND